MVLFPNVHANEETKTKEPDWAKYKFQRLPLIAGSFCRFLINIENYVCAHRRAAPNGGRSSALRARRCVQTWFSILPTKRQKCAATQQKNTAIQPNPRYSTKNNPAIRMTATFVPKCFSMIIHFYFFYYNFFWEIFVWFSSFLFIRFKYFKYNLDMPKFKLSVPVFARMMIVFEL